MGIDEASDVRRKLEEAQSLMMRALALLDEANAPGHVGAHLDMAICSLGSALEEGEITPEAECPSRQDSCAWPTRPAA